MADVVVRDLDDDVVDRLKARAAAERTSLEQKLRDVLTDAAKPTRAEVLAEMQRIRAMTPQRLASESVELIREDRDAH
ncbi:MAG: hypothetical protein EA405_14305 [Rhodospirillales bacterium]|nr:MAG: hypothetical protein EA405_14305 [Rhodospirillales bacterium]